MDQHHAWRTNTGPKKKSTHRPIFESHEWCKAQEKKGGS
jgi:hypothetical protein